MNSFGPQRKRSYEFSFVCPCVCPRHKERFCEDFFFFFSFLIPKTKEVL